MSIDNKILKNKKITLKKKNVNVLDLRAIFEKYGINLGSTKENNSNKNNKDGLNKK